MDNWIAFLYKNRDVFLAVFAFILGGLMMYMINRVKQVLWEQKVAKQEILEKARQSPIIERDESIVKKFDSLPIPDYSEILLEKKVSEWNAWSLDYSLKMKEKMNSLRIPE